MENGWTWRANSANRQRLVFVNLQIGILVETFDCAPRLIELAVWAPRLGAEAVLATIRQHIRVRAIRGTALDVVVPPTPLESRGRRVFRRRRRCLLCLRSSRSARVVEHHL